MYDFSKDNHGRRGVRPGAKPPIRLPRHPRAARPPPSLLVQVASAVDDFSAYPREVGPRPITPLGRVVVHDTHIGMSESAVEGRRRTPSSLQAAIPAVPPSSEQPAASAVPHPTNPGGESSRLRGRLFSHPSRRRGRLLSHPPARGLQVQLPDPPPPPEPVRDDGRDRDPDPDVWALRPIDERDPLRRGHAMALRIEGD